MIFVSLLISLVLTLIIETPIALLNKIPLKRIIQVNLLTNPAVVIIYSWAKYFNLQLIAFVVILEVLAIILEGYFYKGYHSKPYYLSLILNFLSFSIGITLQHFIT